MTITHPSHFDLQEVSRTETSIVFSGTLAGCRKMAFSHGMEVAEYCGRLIEFDGVRAVSAPATSADFSVCYFVGGGLIHRGRDEYTLVMPLHVWMNA
jgi:hypothetical protein